MLERDFFRHILKYWEGKTLHENCALDGLMIDSPFFARTLLTCVSDVGRGCNLHVINTKLRINYYFSTLFRKTNASMGVKHKLFCQADMYYVHILHKHKSFCVLHALVRNMIYILDPPLNGKKQ